MCGNAHLRALSDEHADEGGVVDAQDVLVVQHSRPIAVSGVELGGGGGNPADGAVPTERVLSMLADIRAVVDTQAVSVRDHLAADKSVTQHHQHHHQPVAQGGTPAQAPRSHVTGPLGLRGARWIWNLLRAEAKKSLTPPGNLIAVSTCEHVH